MNTRTLIVLCLFALGCCAPSDKWCVINDDTDAYQSALDYLGSSTVNQSQLQQLIDDVFSRAGCHRLQMSSANNISCEQVKLFCVNARAGADHLRKVLPIGVQQRR